MAVNSNSDVKFMLAADDSAVVAAFNGLKAKAGTAGAGLQGAFEPLTAIFGQLGVAAAAIGAVMGTVFVKSITDTAEMTERSMDMARALGMSTNEARAAQMALKDIGAEAGEYQSAAKGMVRQLAENEDKMKAMGLATRDASGNLRPMNDLVLDGIKVLGSYKEGTDRALASKVLFGRGIEADSKLMLYNQQVVDDSRATMQELSLEVGANAVAAWQSFDAASDRAGFGIEGVKKAIGDSLLPVATTLINTFNAVLPAAITVLRGALGGITTTLLGVRQGIVMVWETLNAMVVSMVEPIRALGAAFFKLLTGDVQGAADELSSIPTVVANAWNTAFAEMTAGAVKTKEQIAALWTPDTAAGGGGGAGKGDRGYKAPPDKPIAEKHEREFSAMPTYEAALEARRLAFTKENDLRDMSKQQELDWWREVLASYNVSSKDLTAITLKTAKLELEILRQSGKDKRAITALQAEDWKAETMDYIAELEERAKFDLDQGNTTQAQYLERRDAFNQMRLQAELEFIQKKIEIAQLDPENNLVALEQLELAKLEIKRRYAALANKINLEQAADKLGPFQTMADSIGAGFNKLGTTLLSNWRNVGNALRGVLASIGQSIIQETVLKPLQAKMVAWAKERLLTMAGIGAKAAEAGAGAAKSQADIPIAGPWLALAAMGLVFAAVGAMGSKVPSASKGFDIPRGMNPLTQLHETEMVLPGKYADVIRDLANGGSQVASATGGGVIQIATTGGDWIHKKDLGALLTKMQRNFEFVR